MKDDNAQRKDGCTHRWWGPGGLSLAIQLKRADAALKVVVVEKQPYPVSEAAYKVGESAVDVGSRYFADTLGMREHLEDAHVKKPGLRFYFSSGDNKDVARRPELGGSAWPKFVSYQLDRGTAVEERDCSNVTSS